MRPAAGTALLLLLAASSRAGDPFDPPMTRLKGEGYAVVQRLDDKASGTAVAAMTLEHPEKGWSRTDVYALLRGLPRLIYTDAGLHETRRLDTALGERALPSPWAGVRALLLRVRNPALDRDDLTILRLEGAGFKRLGVFREGKLEDLDGDGRPEIVSRERPLGRFHRVSCREFFASGAAAVRTDVHAWRGGRLLLVSSEFPDLYDGLLAEDEARLLELEKTRRERPSDYLAAALTLYFDLASKGERRRGWERLRGLSKPPAAAPPGASECAAQLMTEARRELGIPEDWP